MHICDTSRRRVNWVQWVLSQPVIVVCWWPGGWFNIKMPSYQYRKSHCGDKTILRPSYLHNGISYTCKTTFLYWIGALVFQHLDSIPEKKLIVINLGSLMLILRSSPWNSVAGAACKYQIDVFNSWCHSGSCDDVIIRLLYESVMTSEMHTHCIFFVVNQYFGYAMFDRLVYVIDILQATYII